MIEVITYLFGDFWHWLGLVILVGSVNGVQFNTHHHFENKRNPFE